MKRRHLAHEASLDPFALRDLVRGPGVDTRQWISFGIVDTELPDDKVVVFDEEYGQAHVAVKLSPSGIPVTCLVASQCAGDGEGEWHPFVKGDTVLVAIPEGSEDAGCTIIGRINRAKAAFPRKVAGQDTTKNNVAFKRQRTPFVHEVAGGWIVRNATTGAFFGIDPQGQLNFGNGDGAGLFIRGDFIGLQNADADVLMQIDVGGKKIVLEADGTKFIVNKSTSTFVTGGTLGLMASGFPAVFHAASGESIVAFMQAFITALATTSPGPLTGAGLAGSLIATMNAALLLLPVTPITLYAPGIAAAFAAKIPDPTGQIPNLGSPGVLIG